MAKDGGLRPLFRQQFRSWQWSTIEVGTIAGGIPDNEFCTPTGVQGWIEFKQTHIFYVQIRPLQISWLMRRCRYGGNAWIAVRRINKSSDELWLMFGDQAERLHNGGLEAISGWCWNGGPGGWNFEEVSQLLHRQ
jgi:hypothetical protein